MYSDDKQKSDDPLQKPITIGSIKIPNRLCRSATNENMANETGVVSQDYVSLYEKLSSGGVGLIITGHMYVDRHGRTIPTMTGIDSDEQIPMLRKTVEIIHRNNAVVFTQLNHAGFKALPELKWKKKIYAPSKTQRATALSSQDIQTIIEAFGTSAARVKKAGFDGIQLHAAHTYLIAQFLSKRLNHRHDQYGGSLVNRQRFLVEIIAAVRDAVGEQYPLTVKLDSVSSSFMTIPPLLPLISLKESLDTGKRLEEAGVNALEISCGFHATKGAYPFKASLQARYTALGKPLVAMATRFLLTPSDVVLNQRIWFEEQHNLSHILLFKQKLQIPILAGSCFRNPVHMRNVLRQNQADMICMCRPYIYDPFFPQKIFKGSNKPSGCINCNLCLFLIPLQQPLQCYYGKTDFKKQNKSRIC